MNKLNYKNIEECLICGNKHLEVVIDLGYQALTGVFPTSPMSKVTKGPLVLKKCTGDENVCGLLQLGHIYMLNEMYGNNYGYRSGLNITMVKHLHSKIEKLSSIRPLKSGDLVLDIGSNDGTSLNAYFHKHLILVGIDPTGEKFRHYYPPSSHLIVDFYSHELFSSKFPGMRAKIITSFAMFYDLERPQEFIDQISQTLAKDGIWCFEQSYLPAMLAANSYDTVCHEHLEFYGVRQIKWMTERANLKIIDIELNDVNGGSFSVVVAHKANSEYQETKAVNQLIENEMQQNLHILSGYKNFIDAVVKSRLELQVFIDSEIKKGKRFAALGASTKGNVLLQYCDLDSSKICCIGDVNPDKFGKFTPGTGIPIISEEEALAGKYDFYIVLPWHFRRFFDTSPRYRHIQLVYPLPSLSFSNLQT